MPYSLVLNLIPRSPIPKTHLSGRHLHALFLDLVKSVDPELATMLHGQTTDKAFTLSPLQVKKYGVRSTEYEGQSSELESTEYEVREPHPAPRISNSVLQFQHDRAISAGTPCWWRISLLDERLFSRLTHLWLNLNSQQIWQLGAADLQVSSVLGTPQITQPWANFVTYQQLYEQASDQQRQIHFAFCTPTTFRVTQYDCALPTKELVFRSLLKRWNQYSGIPFLEAAIEPIYPSFFDIRTEIAIDSRSKLIGCVGQITFQVLGEIEPSIIKQINALADFALYAGVGRKTPMGMGMVRRVRS